MEGGPPAPAGVMMAPSWMWSSDEVLRQKKDMLESLLNTYTAPVPADYRFELPTDFQKYAFTDRAPTGMAQVAAASLMGTHQAFDRPLEPFSYDQIRSAFNLGDEALPPRSPLRSSTELPHVEIRCFSSTIVPEVVAPPTTTTAAGAPTGGKKRKSGAAPPPSSTKRPSVGGASKPAPAPAPRPPEVVKPPEPPAPPPPPPTVPVLLDALPAIDTSQLVRRRRVTDLTADEVETITGDIVRKLKNKKCRAWGSKNPLDIDIQPDNCAKQGIPNYFDIIKEPMNLVMMQKKVRNREYATLYDLRRDIDLMIQNATTFNPPGEVVHTFALDVRKAFEAQWRSAILEYDVIDDQQQQEQQQQEQQPAPAQEPPTAPAITEQT